MVDNFALSLAELVFGNKHSVGIIASVDFAHVGPRYGDTYKPHAGTIEQHLSSDASLLSWLGNNAALTILSTGSTGTRIAEKSAGPPRFTRWQKRWKAMPTGAPCANLTRLWTIKIHLLPSQVWPFTEWAGYRVSSANQPTVAVETLGCKVNQFESSYFLEVLRLERYCIVPFRERADIYIVHSCAVTAKAGSDTAATQKGTTRQSGCFGCGRWMLCSTGG